MNERTMSWQDRMQAAIALKVPQSGIPELDAMIRESRRLDMATAAMQGHVFRAYRANGESGIVAESAVVFADALLAASEKEQPC